MAIVSYCGRLSQSGVRWSPYIMEIHFESVDPTEMHSDFGLRGFTLNIDSPENRLAECSVQFIYIQTYWQAVGSDGLRAELSDMWCWSFRQSNCLDRMAFRRQESYAISRDCGKRLHGSSESFRYQEAERILPCETVNLCWQWIRSKHHVRVQKRGSYYLVNNSVRSCNHAMSMTLNLGAVGIIWPASKPIHILYLKPLHSRVHSQSSLITYQLWENISWSHWSIQWALFATTRAITT